MTDHPIIRKIEAYESLSADEHHTLLSLCNATEEVARRRDLVSEGESPGYVRVMLDGWSARYALNSDGGRRITAFLLPGDFCDIHVTALDVMDHGIVAITDGRVGLIPREAIDAVTRSTPALTRAFWRSTLVDGAIMRQWLVNAGRRSAYETIGHLLCELHVRLQQIGLAADDTIVVPLTQEELGDATGLTAVHVNRMLRELRENGLIEIDATTIRIPSIAALRAASDFDPTYLHLRDASRPS